MTKTLKPMVPALAVIALVGAWVTSVAEAPSRPMSLPALGKGQLPHALPPQLYAMTAEPIASSSDPVSPLGLAAPQPGKILLVSSSNAIVQAIATAHAGQVIEIAPGRYTINSPLRTMHDGDSAKNIIVRARQPGQVTLAFTAPPTTASPVEGFVISHPYWVIENLTLRGVCPQHSQCEHAFHVVGRARATVLRNNHVEDFNAHVKVNGEGGQYPDDGLLQHNTLTNTTRRETAMPVTPVDIVAASGWRVTDNLVSNFVKAQSNQISYGMFMKGAGRNGRFERNLVICKPPAPQQSGTQVGISLGGGNTGAAFCRDQQCASEHTGGLIANNIIAHCNDVGIDINKSENSTVVHNTLINTRGIAVRHAPGFARIEANLSPAGVTATRGGQMQALSNDTSPATRWFVNPDLLDLTWRQSPMRVPIYQDAHDDFFRHTRSDMTNIGATAAAHTK